MKNSGRTKKKRDDLLLTEENSLSQKEIEQFQDSQIHKHKSVDLIHPSKTKQSIKTFFPPHDKQPTFSKKRKRKNLSSMTPEGSTIFNQQRNHL